MNEIKNNQLLTARGIVTEALPSALFRVKITDKAGETGEKEILAYLSGKMRLHRIKVLIGDTVEVILDQYGGKGRIVKRL
jgi:translation initiation factor IF-1